MAKFDRKALKRRLVTALELPMDVMLDLPSLNVIGDEKIIITNHKGIIEYHTQQVRIKSSVGVIKILGVSLTLKEIGKENITITGTIRQIIFLNAFNT